MVCASAVALDSDRQQKVIVQGPGCVTKLKQNETDCPKGLTIEQGTMQINAAAGTIYHKNKGIDRVLMSGNQVYMEQMMEDQEKMIIRANQVDYRKAEEKVFLSGNVSITSAIGVTTGENIEFDLQTQEIISAGDANTQFKMEIDQKND